MAQVVWPYSVSRVLTPTIPTVTTRANMSGGGAARVTSSSPLSIQNAARGTPDKSGLISVLVKTPSGDLVPMTIGQTDTFGGISQKTWLYVGVGAAALALLVAMRGSKRLREQPQ